LKIKTQLRIFLIGVILVPILAVVLFQLYHYLTRPDRLLLDGYRQIQNIDNLSLTKRDLKVFRQLLSSLPPNLEFIILVNHGDILQTTIPDFKGQEHIEMPKMFQYMNDTSDNYFYQLSSPPLESKKHDVLFISRLSRNSTPKKKRIFKNATRAFAFHSFL